MPKSLRRGLVMVTLGVSIGLNLGLAPTLPATAADSAKKSTAATSAQPDDAVRAVLMGLEAAISSKNIQNASNLFTEDIDFIDESGEEIRGLKALHERFEQRLNDPSAPEVGIHPTSITFPADNVALVIGEVSRKQGQADLPASRFSMVMVKKNNAWAINELHETAMQAAQTENHLQELNWLIGQWSVDRPDVSAQVTTEWAEGKKFLTSKHTVTKTGKQPQVDRQVIGWDPQHNTIISWHFDSNGSFGSGVWTKQPNENKWTVEVAGVGADGSNSTASNVVTVKSPDEVIWQSTHRSLDGTPVGDTEPITMHRVKR